MKKVISLVGTFALPFVALAQTTAITVLAKVKEILNLVVPILITLAVIYFFWGLIQYIIGDAAKKEEGRSTMIYGIITIFVMVAVFGLVQLIGTTLSIEPGTGTKIPILP